MSLRNPTNRGTAIFVRVKKSGAYEYLQIVHNQRIDGVVRQQVVATLDATRAEDFEPQDAVRLGPPLVFGRLWEELGLPQVLHTLLQGRKFEFSVERAVLMTVLHRLMVSGSDRAAERWCRGYALSGIEDLELHHLYRAMGWLGEPLPAAEQSADQRLGPRCRKDLIEERLFARRRDLFTSLELVFFDTTSIYFEGEGGESPGEQSPRATRPDARRESSERTRWMSGPWLSRSTRRLPSTESVPYSNCVPNCMGSEREPRTSSTRAPSSQSQTEGTHSTTAGGRVAVQHRRRHARQGALLAARSRVLLREEPDPSRPQPPSSQGAAASTSGCGRTRTCSSGFRMWHWDRSTRSPDRSPGEILQDSIDTGAFVFLGRMVPEPKVDVNQILQDFDRLYDLYEYVESEPKPTGRDSSGRSGRSMGSARRHRP